MIDRWVDGQTDDWEHARGNRCSGCKQIRLEREGTGYEMAWCFTILIGWSENASQKQGTSVAAEESDVQDESVEWQEARPCTWWVTVATRLLLWEQQELLEFLSRVVSPANVRLEFRAPLCWGQPLRATEWREPERSRRSGTRVPGETPTGNEVAGTGAAGILCSFLQSGESSESGVLTGKD